MNIKLEIENLIRKALEKALKESKVSIDVKDIIVEIPKDRSFGDYTTNVAMMLAKQFKKNPK